MKNRVGTIDAPGIPETIPSHSQWILGQGIGAWFCIDKVNKNTYNIKRYTPKGSVDCDRVFEIEENGSVFNIKEPYHFTHISHCAKCRIAQNGITFVFNYINS